MKATMNLKDEKKFYDEICKQKVKCKCSHTTIMVHDRIICSYCGNWIYKTPEIEFKYKLQEKMKGKKNE